MVDVSAGTSRGSVPPNTCWGHPQNTGLASQGRSRPPGDDVDLASQGYRALRSAIIFVLRGLCTMSSSSLGAFPRARQERRVGERKRAAKPHELPREAPRVPVRQHQHGVAVGGAGQRLGQRDVAQRCCGSARCASASTSLAGSPVTNHRVVAAAAAAGTAAAASPPASSSRCTKGISFIPLAARRAWPS